MNNSEFKPSSSLGSVSESAPVTIAYGRAFYYPHINFSNEKWIRLASLYYKGLNRIVPRDYKTINDCEIVNRLNENEDFIRNITPDGTASIIENDFLSFAFNVLTNEKHRCKLLKSFQTELPDMSPFRIHIGKMSNSLVVKLIEMNLVNEVKNEDSHTWYEFEPLTGIIYMTCLANALAQLNQIPVVTDNPIFQPFTRGIQSDKFKGKNDISETLASLVIQAAIPENIENIPISKIVEFRKKHDDERHLFYNEINKLVTDLGQVYNQETLKDCLEHRTKDIQIAVDNLDRSFQGLKLSTATLMLGLTIPAFASGLGAAFAATGIVTVATIKLMSQFNEYQKSKNSSPYSYVLSLKNNLKSNTFAQQLLEGKIVF